jgi:hypothetical protein
MIVRVLHKETGVQEVVKLHGRVQKFTILVTPGCSGPQSNTGGCIVKKMASVATITTVRIT